jgi:hypothetical protein
MAKLRQALGGMLQGASQEMQRKRQAQQALEQEMQKLMMQEQIKAQFGGWKPQTQEEAMEYERSKKADTGYQRAYVVDPQGGYKQVEFPQGQRGRVITQRSLTGEDGGGDTTPMWLQWVQGVPLPTEEGEIRPPRTKEEAYSKMIMGGADMMNPELQQAIEQLPSQSDVYGQQVGAFDPRRMLPGYTADIGQKDIYPEMPQQTNRTPQRTQVNYPQPQQQSDKVIVEKDGQQYELPKNQLQQAITEGYRLVR